LSTRSADPQAVLLVDDDVDTLEMYALGLSQAGYRALTATDVQSAAVISKCDRPSAIVTDLRLAGHSGWTLIQALKSDPSTREIAVIVLTGHSDASIARTAREAGCAAVLTKPCLPEDLAKTLRRLLPGDGHGGDGDGGDGRFQG
jgi:CheY-like chemotaxis protein